jgi:hypothetical protein
MAAIFAFFYFGGKIVKKVLNKKLTNMFSAGFSTETKNKKDEVIYNQEDVIVLKGEAKNKKEKKDNNER